MNKDIFFDINKLPEDGYLVLPISMARIQKGQSPEVCYEILSFFESKLSRFGLDVVILYTDGLYFNADQAATTLRHPMNEQVLSHKNRLENLIVKSRRFMPQAIHYVPWDYVLLNAENFNGTFNAFRAAYKKNAALRQAIKQDLGKRQPTVANVNFVLEEIVATHLIRQKLVTLPRTLVREDNFRLVIYPGPYIRGDAFQFTNGILPLNKKLGKRGYPFGAGIYDYDQRVFCDFRRMGDD